MSMSIVTNSLTDKPRVLIAQAGGGRCASCGGPIEPGSEYALRDGGLCHTRCPQPGSPPSADGGARCFRCGSSCSADSVVQAGLRWHSACWNAATDPARIAAVNASERARDAGAGMLIEDYMNEEQAS